MRSTFFKRLGEEIAGNDRIFFVTADVGFNLVEDIFKRFPKRTLNVGIAEQNLIGIAAGLCNAGFLPVCYSYSNFLAQRCLEQIRNDLCLHSYHAILVGITTGFDNGGLGPTHHALDDIASIKGLPNIRIYSPSSNESMASVFNEAIKSAGEVSFIRTTKSDFVEGKASHPNRFLYRSPQNDILIISHGKVAQNALKASEHTDFDLFAMDRIKPLDRRILKRLLKSYEAVMVAEDNFNSGLFNSICQSAVEERTVPHLLVSLSPKESYDKKIGNTAFLEHKHGVSPQGIVATVKKLKKHLIKT